MYSSGIVAFLTRPFSAELLRRIFEIGPLACPRCGQTMRMVAFITVVRIVPYPACELPGTSRVPSSHWLDASSTKGDTWNRGKQIPIQT
jgi:hypothetical protein